MDDPIVLYKKEKKRIYRCFNREQSRNIKCKLERCTKSNLKLYNLYFLRNILRKISGAAIAAHP